MAITVVHQPDEVSLSKGRISYGLQGSGPVITAGVKAKNYFNLYNQPQNGDVLTLAWKGQTIRFTFRTVVGSDPLDLPIFAVSDAYVTALIPKFQTLKAIDEDFIVSLVEDDAISSLCFEARQPGAQYNFAQTLVGGPEIPLWRFNTLPFVVGADPVLKANYGIYVELWCQKAGSADFERIVQENLDVDANGYVEVPLSDYLHTHLASDWPPLTNPIPEVMRAVQSHRQYYIRAAEAWGEPQQPYHLATSPVRQVYFGGVDFERKSTFSLAAVIRATEQADEDRALRFGPPWRFVRPDEQQFLTFVALRQALEGVRVEFNLTFDDGNEYPFSDLIEPFDLAQFEKITVPVGIAQVDLMSRVPEGRQLASYTVRLLHQSGYQSMAYVYLVDYQHKPYARYFGYLNSFGAPETLLTYGKGSPELKIFSAQAEMVRQDTDGPMVPQFIEYDLRQQQQYEVATGWLSSVQQELMRDFFRSPEKYQLWQTRVLPIRVTSSSVRQTKDGENQVAHKFDYEHRFLDAFFGQDFDGQEELPQPPPGFVSAGDLTVVVEPKPFAYDPTIANFIRNLTGVDLGKFFQAFAWGNHATAGYLSQETATPLFAGKEHGHLWGDLAEKPPLLTEGIGMEMTKWPKRDVLTVTASVSGKSFTLQSALKKLLKSIK